MNAEPSHILIADDHSSTREALRTLLEMKSFVVTAAATGDEALTILTSIAPPRIAIVDWEMPGATGLDICRAVRGLNGASYIYIIVITARAGEENIAEAMAAGADDFIHKPCGVAELLARVRNGQRTIALQQDLAGRIAELENATDSMRQLKRLLPICMYCKKIRDDADYWHEIEAYIRTETGTDFSHGICPNCMQAEIVEFDARRARRTNSEPSS